MIGLILTIIIGLGIAFFSSRNASGITVGIGEYPDVTIPIYIVTVGAYVLGIVLAWIIKVPQAIGTHFRISSLGRTIKTGNTTIEQLQKRIHTLETEIDKLRERTQTSLTHALKNDADKPNSIRNFLQYFSRG